MSEMDRPGDPARPEGDPTRRVDRPDPDATRRVARPDADPTGRIDPPPGQDATQRIDPAAGGYGSPTREQAPWEGEAQPYRRPHEEPDDYGSPPPPVAAPRGKRRSPARTFGIWLLGLVIGFVAAFLIIALTTDDTADADLAAQQRIVELEAELAERDAQIDDLEARLAEAEAAAGDRAEDIEDQRAALDEQRAVLEEWSQQLADREQAVAQREAGVAERERALEEQPDVEVPDTDDLPDIDLDDETVDSIVQRILDGLRDLFR